MGEEENYRDSYSIKKLSALSPKDVKSLIERLQVLAPGGERNTTFSQTQATAAPERIKIQQKKVAQVQAPLQTGNLMSTPAPTPPPSQGNQQGVPGRGIYTANEFITGGGAYDYPPHPKTRHNWKPKEEKNYKAILHNMREDYSALSLPDVLDLLKDNGTYTPKEQLAVFSSIPLGESLAILL